MTRPTHERPLRVWLFTDVFPPRISGAAVIAQSWATHLPRFGVDLCVHAPTGSLRRPSQRPPHHRYRSIEHVGYWGDDFSLFSSVLELRRLKRLPPPDVVLVSTPGRVGLLGATYAAQTATPSVAVYTTDVIDYATHYAALRPSLSVGPKLLHFLASQPRSLHHLARRTGLDLGIQNELAARVVRELHNAAEHVVLLGPKLQEISSAWRNGEGVTVLPAGVDPIGAPVAVPRAPGPLHLLCVGRLAREKANRVAVECVAELHASGCDAVLTFVGDGEERAALTSLAHRRGIADRVTFTGPLPRAAVWPFYWRADRLLFPSTSDTQALVLNEAALAGLPIILSDRQVNQVAEPGRSAWWAAPDGRSFASAVLESSANPDERARRAKEALRRAEELTEEGQAERLSAILRSIARSDRA